MSEELEEMLEEEDTQKGKYMTFVSGDECYGIGINYVNEIIGLTKITEVPETVDYIKGLINLRGKIIPVIDVRLRFKKDPVPYNDRTCVIVITVEQVVVGLIVDTIAEVCTIDDADIVPPPSMVNNSGASRFVYGIGKVGDDVKLLINPANLISEEEQEILKAMA